MTERFSFNYEHFLSLSGSELVNYVEPFVTTQFDAIPKSVYDALSSSLACQDEEHAVYSLDICMLLRPREFVSRAVKFLSHSDAAVCCAACRVIERMPATLMPADLRGKITAIPIVDLFTTDFHTGNKVRIGTNEELIRGLLAKLA